MISDSPNVEAEDSLPNLLVDEFALSQSESDSDCECSSQSVKQCSILTIEDFTCPICLDLLIEPLSLSCGHSYCRTCLFECVQRGAKRCPSCRCSIDQSMNLSEAPQCILLARIIAAAFPQLYHKRQSINQTIKQSWKSRFPVCFVDTVLFPHQSMLIHLCEPRYNIMCERLNNQSSSQSIKRFALFSTRYQANLDKAIGLVVETSEITRSTNGSYLLFITAVERCCVVDCWEEPETHSLHQAQVQLIVDDDKQTQQDQSIIAAKVSAIKESIECFDALSQSTGSSRSFVREFGSIPADPCERSFWLFSCLLNDRSARGDLSVADDDVLIPKVLASQSVAWRLERGLQMLNEAIQQLKIQAQNTSNQQPMTQSLTRSINQSANQSRPLQFNAPEYVPVEHPIIPVNQSLVPAYVMPTHSFPSRQGHQQRRSVRHPSRGYVPRNSRPAWPFGSAEQQIRHHQPYRDLSRSFDEQ